jgi:CheY-like chemotaxis protein
MSATSSSGSATAAPAPSSQQHSERLLLAVYSDDRSTRDKVRRAVGRRPAADLGLVEWREFATLPALLRAVDTTRFDVLVLDGEAAPAGGLGVARQLKDEIYDCPPVLVLTGRPQDAWLAAWSKAEAAVPHPLDPRAVVDAVADLARRRAGRPAPGSPAGAGAPA